MSKISIEFIVLIAAWVLTILWIIFLYQQPYQGELAGAPLLFWILILAYITVRLLITSFTKTKNILVINVLPLLVLVGIYAIGLLIMFTISLGL